MVTPKKNHRGSKGEVVEHQSSVPVYGEMLSIDRGCKATCVVIP